MANTWTTKDLESDDKAMRVDTKSANKVNSLSALAREIEMQIPGLSPSEAMQLAKIRGS